jgi:hypothetical protein
MMIFEYTLPQVMSGKKTQTRRLVKPGDVAGMDAKGKIVAVVNNGREKWRVGKSYAVQPGRARPQVARIEITGLRRGHADKITTADAHAEGFPNEQAFFDEWRRINGAKNQDAEIWIVEFRLKV